MPIDSTHPVLVHFYRGVVGHADVWRQRMDATTNWAAAVTAGMVTFAFGDSRTPHIVLLLAIGFNVIFLLMESRRYQIHDLWRRRFRTLNQYLIAPVLAPDGWSERGFGQEGNRFCVTRGIEFTDVPLRINCRPELTIITAAGT